MDQKLQSNCIDIDYIMDLLDWNNSVEEQEKGVFLARSVKSINVFLQPLDPAHNKNVWDNCAKILCARSDEELSPYLFNLFEWLEDMNWPGAWYILERLRMFDVNIEDGLFMYAFNICKKRARALEKKEWLDNLSMIHDSDYYIIS